MIEVAQAFLAVWFWSTVFVVLPQYYNNWGEKFKNFSFPGFVDNWLAKPACIKFTVKHTLPNDLCFVQTFFKVTEKNTFCM